MSYGGGRGAYYKQKYGNKRGGRDGRGDNGNGAGGGRYFDNNSASDISNQQKLNQTLIGLDRAQYGAYKQLKTPNGTLFDAGFTLFFDKLQSDPFAPPSKIRVRFPLSMVQYPQEWLTSPARRVALCDFLTRQVLAQTRANNTIQGFGGSGFASKKGNSIRIDSPNQNIVERSSCIINDQFVEARLAISLPAAGRRILGRDAAELVCSKLPNLISHSLPFSALNAELVKQHIESHEDQEFVRQHELKRLGLLAFIADGSVLPRRSGDSDQPLQNAIPFESPESCRVTVETPNKGSISGFGFKKGINVIVGGGFHGKSTVLNALQMGVYSKIPGDGREMVVTDATAIKIRAEDGRHVSKTNISEFINNLPSQNDDTTQFSTTNASGSTSQAANIAEAIEAGCNTLLIDEDESATNFMFRDKVMAELVQHEPITPFLSKIKALSDNHISTILVLGSSAAFFPLADSIIKMENYKAIDITQQAKQLALERGIPNVSQPLSSNILNSSRTLIPSTMNVFDSDRVKMSVEDSRRIQFKNLKQMIDLGAVSQITGLSQLRALGAMLVFVARNRNICSQFTMPQLLDYLEQQLNDGGLDAFKIYNDAPNDYVRPRRLEMACALNRCREVHFRLHSSQSSSTPANNKRQHD